MRGNWLDSEVSQSPPPPKFTCVPYHISNLFLLSLMQKIEITVMNFCCLLVLFRTVYYVLFALSFTVPPRFNPPQTLPTIKQIRNENQIMDYTCTAEAKPYAKIRWMLDGQILTNNPPYNITERTAGPAASKLFTTFGYLNIKHLTLQQYGNFSCVAINDAGFVKQNTELEVRCKS